MSQDMETILRNSLDAVDRGRRWAMLGVAALFVATLFMLVVVFHVRTIGEGASKLLFLVFAAHILFVACCTAVVMLHITRMTKTVLRALDLKQKE
jgi:nitrate reductase gamma subunit